MRKLKLQIEILEIDVNDGFYEIHFKYSIDGKKWKTDVYDSDFDNGLSDRLWKKELEKKVAMETVLQKITEEIEL